MAINLGGGGFTDPSVPVGPRADLMQARTNNIEREKNEAREYINMMKTFAAEQGISMSHMAEDFGPELGRAFSVLNGGDQERATQMIDKMVGMPVTQSQETRRRSQLETNRNRNLVDFNPYGETNQVSPASSEQVSIAGLNPQSRQNFSQSQMETQNPLLARQGQMQPGQVDPIALMLAKMQMSQPQQSNINFGQTPVMAQGTSPLDQLAKYGQKTGDDHFPAMIGTEEIVLNKEVAQRYPQLAGLNDMFPNKDAAGMATSVGGIPSFEQGYGGSFGMMQMAEEQARRNALYDEGMRADSERRNSAAVMDNAGSEMERNAALDERATSGEDYVMMKPGEIDYDKYELQQRDGGNRTAYKEGEYYVFAKPKKGVATDAPQQLAYPYQKDMQEGLVDAQRVFDPQFEMGVSDRDQQPSDQAPTASLGLYPRAEGAPAAAVEEPVREGHGGYVPPEATTVEVTPEEEMKLKYEIYSKGEVNTPAEYETVMKDNGFFAQMDTWNQKLAEVSPALAQHIPSAKYYADQLAAQDDPKSLLELQKLQSEIAENYASMTASLASGDWSEARKIGQELQNLGIVDQDAADLANTQAQTNANFALAELRGIQSLGALADLEMLPLEAEKMMADIAKINDDIRESVGPETQLMFDNYQTMFEEYQASDNKTKWLKDNGDNFGKLVDAMAASGYGATTGDYDAGIFRRQQDNAPVGDAYSFTGADMSLTPEEAAAKRAEEIRLANEREKGL